MGGIVAGVYVSDKARRVVLGLSRIAVGEYEEYTLIYESWIHNERVVVFR